MTRSFHERSGTRCARDREESRTSGFLSKLLCGGDVTKEKREEATRDMIAMERRRRSMESATSSESSETEVEVRGDEEEEERVTCIGRSHLPGQVFSSYLSSAATLIPNTHSSTSTNNSSRCRKNYFFSSATIPVMSTPGILGKIGKVTGAGKPLRVLILGQAAVGKTALTVRFITKRFIGEYDPTLERKYTFQSEIDHDPASFEIFDTAGQAEDSLHLEENIRWADAFILVYSVTDRCSFDECTRLKFLINHRKRSRRSSPSSTTNSSQYIPVVLVGNQNDLLHERMVTFEEGQKHAENLGCTGFYDISVRESYEEVREVFHDLYIQCKVNRKLVKTGSPPLTRGLSTSVLPVGLEDRLSDSECGGSGSTVKRKASVSRRFMRRMFKQDSFFRDSLTKHESELKEEDSGQDSG